ncbi:MAG: bifunctional (p)ppGpp synthetase/guanosine-3',5'-bis(diphosphate) 3'-pyrophosphohydrolase [Candidatus Delongbacteria bacterium]|nr:bifunctional (p)ppGpp synthetase/guanosine-3',5'-bis(diphosphate) 3'-pyrophosphohydrolase [Candidatus Delongbacteria bacterium]MBN2835686.1 bifunctional (p)ppGpp synthetase/guanosine-3',5'-bis(diphosphate) 3'-pyrophosphohydrolase [Candidatus Delongbacteria bacterium]
MPSRYLKIIEKIIEDLKLTSVNVNEKLILDAFNFTNDIHKDSFRRSGRPYMEHPVSMCQILMEFKVDDVAIASALLYDIIDSGNITVSEIEERFGKQVASIVKGLSKINDLKFEVSEQAKAENFRKLVISMVKDIRILIIKFSDRLHNMRTIKYLNEEKQKRIATETLEIYAPIAYRFGMYNLKSELEDLAFEVVNPINYENIKSMMQYSRSEMEKQVEVLKPLLLENLENAGIKASVNGRVKHYYSILRKLQTRKKSFDEILDLMALRIIIEDDNIEACYKALSIVHSVFRPMQGQFSDLIATPKSNGYQSLHTKIIHEGQIFEIQIRTRQMHEIAEFGLSAHWRYKSNNNKGNDKIDEYIDKIKILMSNSFELNDPKEILEDIKSSFSSNEVYVFSPKKDIFTLPEGATPVDFAYKIHESIGNRCIAAKVSGKITPLDTKLENGDIVEIITSTKQEPSHEWLNFVVSPKARSLIKAYLKKKQFDQTVALGKEIFTNEIENLNLEFTEEDLLDASMMLGLNTIETLYQEIGSGNIQSKNVIRKIIPDFEEDHKESFLKKMMNKLKISSKERKLAVRNLRENIKYGDCCFPLPGDKVIGVLDEESVLVVHRSDCQNLSHISSDKIFSLNWETEKSDSFVTRIRVISEDRKGLLFDLAKVLQDSNVDLRDFNMKIKETLVITDCIATVNNLSHYSRIRKKLSKIDGVIRVSRSLDD